MEPIQKQIEEALRECLAFVPGEEPGVVTLSYAESAAAIFERLQERVVWETKGFVVHGKKTSVIRIVGSGANLYPGEMLDLDCHDGEPVEVTVRKRNK